MKPMSRLAVVSLMCVFLTRLADAQASGGQSNQWFWGAQVGGLLYRTNSQGYHAAPLIGAHWLITRGRGALYIGGEEAFFTTNATATAFDPVTKTNQTISFSKVRRIFAGLIAFPRPGHIDPFLGLGLAINTVVDPSIPTDASNKANAWVVGGVQINVSKLAVFGQYVVSTNAGSFLLMNEQHSVQGGVRYTFGTSKEDVTSQH